LALDADIYLHKGGRMSLDDFLKEEDLRKDILEKVIIKKTVEAGSFQTIRNSTVDYAILSAAVAKIDGKYRISVGARPGVAKCAIKAMEHLNNKEMDEKNIMEACDILSEELYFGSNSRGASEYRKEISKVLAKRAIMEVAEWR